MGNLFDPNPSPSELAQREALLREEIMRQSGGAGPFVQPAPAMHLPPRPATLHEPAGVAAPPRLSQSLATVTPEGSKLYAVNFLTGVVDTSFGSFVLGADEIAKVAFVALQALDRNLGAVLAALAREHGVDKLLQGPEPAAEAPANPSPQPATIDPAVMAAALAQLEGMGRTGRTEDEDMEEPPHPDPKPTPVPAKRTRRR